MPFAIARMLILLAAVAGAACAPRQATKGDLDSVKSGSVVVVVPNELVTKYVGLTVFGNEFYATPVSRDFRSQLRERLTQALSVQCHWQVRPSGLDDAGLWPPYKENLVSGMFSPNMYTTGESVLAPIASELSAALKSSTADALIVLVPMFGAEPNSVYGEVAGIEETHNTGMGFYTRGRKTNAVLTYVWMDIYLYRGGDTKVSSLGQFRGFEPLEGTEFKAWSQYDQAEQNVIIESINKLIDKSMPQLCGA